MNYGWGPWRPDHNATPGPSLWKIGCPVFHEARRKFHCGEMTLEQAIKWMESQPGWAPHPNCQCHGCKSGHATQAEEQ